MDAGASSSDVNRMILPEPGPFAIENSQDTMERCMSLPRVVLDNRGCSTRQCETNGGAR